jgi:hypothetical protein
MWTRDDLWHTYFPLPAGRVHRDGAVRVEYKDGIAQTWAVSRPTSSFDPVGAPYYYGGMAKVNPPIARGGTMKLTPHRPNIEMDPSDSTTWQRSYRFS